MLHDIMQHKVRRNPRLTSGIEHLERSRTKKKLSAAGRRQFGEWSQLVMTTWAKTATVAPTGLINRMVSSLLQSPEKAGWAGPGSVVVTRFKPAERPPRFLSARLEEWAAQPEGVSAVLAPFQKSRAPHQRAVGIVGHCLSSMLGGSRYERSASGPIVEPRQHITAPDERTQPCGRNSGKRIVSRIPASVKSMISRSIPIPMPPIGGAPCSRAARKSSSNCMASGSPAAAASDC